MAKKEVPSKLSVPLENNKKLEKLISGIKKHKVLNTLLRMSNINAIDRMGFNDHGPVHVKITANLALRILRILEKRKIAPNIVKNYGMSKEDAEVIVVTGAALHDIGMAVHRQEHETLSTIFAPPIIDNLLSPIYKKEEERTIIKYEALQTIYSHEPSRVPLTIEGGVVKVADALDMEKGRARIPYEAGQISIHSVSALAIESVQISEDKERPVKISILMSNPAGVFQVDNLLQEKIRTSGIEEMLKIEAKIIKDGKEEVIKEY